MTPPRPRLRWIRSKPPATRCLPCLKRAKMTRKARPYRRSGTTGRISTAKALALSDAASGDISNEDALRPRLGALGGTCKDCHRDYRVKQ